MIKDVVNRSKSLQIWQIVSESKLFWISFFAVLTALAAQITIPTKPIPFTLQTLFVILSGAVLGARNGAISQLLYLTLGIIGLPVFAQIPDAPIGLARLFGPTGGYLLAFPAAAFITGYLLDRKRNYWSVVASMFIGEIVILFIGVLHLTFFYTGNFEEAIKYGASIFTVWMAVKVFIATLVYT
ncbi:MAG: biotin transporter BioY, partial [Ignavibacteriaceae bacterium]|nr:biotin transporter BioY [Ignavibacteriaceae bacterium]